MCSGTVRIVAGSLIRGEHGGDALCRCQAVVQARGRPLLQERLAIA